MSNCNIRSRTLHSNTMQLYKVLDLNSISNYITGRKKFEEQESTDEPGAPRRTSSEPTAFPALLRNSATSAGTADGSSLGPSHATAWSARTRATSRWAISGAGAPPTTGPGPATARTVLDGLPLSRRGRERGRRRAPRLGRKQGVGAEAAITAGSNRRWSSSMPAAAAVEWGNGNAQPEEENDPATQVLQQPPWLCYFAASSGRCITLQSPG
ncbi:hypothetical protein U9M48_008967 [Paspalum notatum var. saurae]|uniref:Uncharacterized protein n=1 Tax=Paspalum notatum var. saurae TaxID=547442 RepID=A0AAQ3SRS5_PASNO